MTDFSFKGGMDAALPTSAATFGTGESVTTKDTPPCPIPVISVSAMTESTKRAYGGSLAEASATVSVLKEVAAEFNLVKGIIIFVRAKKMRIMDIEPRLNDSVTLICGPEASSARP